MDFTNVSGIYVYVNRPVVHATIFIRSNIYLFPNILIEEPNF